VISRATLRRIVSIVALGAAPSLADAAIPVVDPGDCVYLVGAPPGLPAATDSAVASGTQILGVNRIALTPCAPPSVDVQADTSPHLLQAWIDEPDALGECVAIAWTANDFQVGLGVGEVSGTVTVEGRVTGSLSALNQAGGEFWPASSHGRAEVKLEILETSRPGGQETIVAASTVFEREVFSGRSSFDERFGRRLEMNLSRGSTYRVRLHLELVGGVLTGSPFGQEIGLTPGRGARYDRIEVCLREPDPVADLTSRLDAIDATLATMDTRLDGIDGRLGDTDARLAAIDMTLAGTNSRLDGMDARLGAIDATLAGTNTRLDGIDIRLASMESLLSSLVDRLLRQDLEWKLYRADCVPTLWMPEANGGHLEQARQLVSDLLADARASGASGVNARVAASRLAAADREIAEGDYQAACRDLASGLRALTTP
jgi:hypothetical protein